MKKIFLFLIFTLGIISCNSQLKSKEEEKKRLREIDASLATLKLKFGENILKETNKYEMYLTNEDDLEGLPESAKEAAAELAKNKGKK